MGGILHSIKFLRLFSPWACWRLVNFFPNVHLCWEWDGFLAQAAYLTHREGFSLVAGFATKGRELERSLDLEWWKGKSVHPCGIVPCLGEFFSISCKTRLFGSKQGVNQMFWSHSKSAGFVVPK